MDILENKKIKVKPFNKSRSEFMSEDGQIRYSGCKSGYVLPWNMSIGSYVQIFEDGEQAEFEKVLGLDPGTLNLYKRKDSWWSKFRIELTKDELELDLSNPIQMLKYKVLL